MLTTHVLDVARGRPAPGVAIVLLKEDATTTLAEAVTNADGRTDDPLLAALATGDYELRFAVGDYLAREHPSPAFYDVIPVRFRIADAGVHHHVPLLLSPFGYSTYRGS